MNQIKLFSQQTLTQFQNLNDQLQLLKNIFEIIQGIFL